MTFRIRLAVKQDVDRIEELMKRSMKILGQGHYSENQIQSCCQYVCVPDLQLIEDGTFFIVTRSDCDTIIGCGGWSYRKKLYAGPSMSAEKEGTLNPEYELARIRAMFTEPSEHGKGIGSLILSASEAGAKNYGFKKATLGATLSGLAFYQAKGWSSVKTERAVLPDGVSIDVIKMEKNF